MLVNMGGLQMNLSYGALAGLIAAGALVVLVLFALPVLVRLGRNLKNLEETTKQTQETMTKVNESVDELLKSSQQILEQTNELMADVNAKAKDLAPVVDAAADLGKSVSDINASARKMASKVAKAPRPSFLSTLLVSAFSRRLRRKGRD
jgi:uncharacterized protein YoxC